MENNDTQGTPTPTPATKARKARKAAVTLTKAERDATTGAQFARALGVNDKGLRRRLRGMGIRLSKGDTLTTKAKQDVKASYRKQA